MSKSHVKRRDLDEPHPERLSETNSFYESIMLAHNLSLANGESGYVDPETGFFVFNAKTLLDLGKCCANLCRHCPFKR